MNRPARPLPPASHPALPRGAALPLLSLSLFLLLAACADKPLKLAQPIADLRAELDAVRARAAQGPASAASDAQPALPKAASAPALPPEPRFDLIVNGAQARDVFLSLVVDTRYSMLVHPAVSGQLSVTLKGVTLREALESLRDVYGYDYHVEGRRITVFPAAMQTRVFTVNYLHSIRNGRSDVRVSGGAAPTNTNPNGTPATPTPAIPTNGTSSSSGQQPESSHVSTATRSDFWAELVDALRSLIGNAEGRAVIASPQAGTVAVRAMPDELRQVESFMRATRVAVERQVMLEAKIVEVDLREGYQSGVDWSILGGRGAIGQTSVSPSVPATGIGTILNPLVSNASGFPVLSTGTQSPPWPNLVSVPSAGGGALGLALSKGGFQGLLAFLESHGDTQVLSSPRVATLNNQKAVLKVGSDDYFVTGVSGGVAANTTLGSNTNVGVTMPTLTLTPFFSGIALDVTPQIDEADMITLHVHPSVTSVSEKLKQVDLGAVGNYQLPLPSSSVNETDTVVRIPDGAIVAIGGLMQQESTRQGSGLPGADQTALTSTLFGNRANTGRKHELVVLIRPTIIRTREDWEQESAQAAQRLEDMTEQRRVIRVGP